MTGLALGTTAAAGVVLVALAASSALRRRRAERLLAQLRPHPGSSVGAAPRLPPLVPAPAWLAPRCAAAFPGFEPDVLTSAWLVAGAVLVLAAAVVGGVGLAVAALVVAVTGPAALLAARRGTADRALEAALPEALEGVARALRSGAGTHQALAEAAAGANGPLGDELDVVVAALHAGSGLEEALGAWERRRPLAGIRLAVAALLLGAEAGGAHARALDGVAASVRARGAVAAEVRALSSQSRLSAGVIALAPVAFAVLAMGADATSASFLLRTPLGLVCLVLGLSLDAVGAWWMHHLAQVEP